MAADEFPPVADSQEFTPQYARILSRYGISESAFERKLGSFRKVMKKRGYTATVPVLGVILAHHPGILRKYRKNIEYAVHGHLYQDYSRISFEDIQKHLAASLKEFANYNIKPHGFRSPLLRWNDRILEALLGHDFIYDSSDAVLWDNVVKVNRSRRNIIKAFYEFKSARNAISMPRVEKGIVRLPATLPNSYLLSNLWKISNPFLLSEIFDSILNATHVRGELFNLNLSIEDFPEYAAPLDMLFDSVKKKKPPVWVASLEEIARWWNERGRIPFEIKEKNDGYHIISDAPKDATFLVRGAGTDVKSEKWFGRWKTVDKSHFIVKSGRMPGIGVIPGTPGKLVDFLRSEGFIVDESTGRERFAIYFDDIYRFDRNSGDEARVLHRIENVYAPLVRLWRWPHKARSALSVTADVDAVTMWDFLRRKRD